MNFDFIQLSAAIGEEKLKHSAEITRLEEKLKENFILVLNHIILSQLIQTAYTSRLKAAAVYHRLQNIYCFLIITLQEMQIERQKHQEMMEKCQNEAKESESKV